MISLLNPFRAARSPTALSTTGISAGLKRSVSKRWYASMTSRVSKGVPAANLTASRIIRSASSRLPRRVSKAMRVFSLKEAASRTSLVPYPAVPAMRRLRRLKTLEERAAISALALAAPEARAANPPRAAPTPARARERERAA